MPSLEGLFRHADIDEVSDWQGKVTLMFTDRGDKITHMIEGEDLADVLFQAERLYRREKTIDSIKTEGLTDEDIDRMTVDYDEVWERGYTAGATDALSRVASSEPELALAGEPITGPVINEEIIPTHAVLVEDLPILLALLNPAYYIRTPKA